jgi:hypothetical protein
MSDFIPTNKDAVKAWFADLFSKTAISGTDVAVINGQKEGCGASAGL